MMYFLIGWILWALDAPFWVWTIFGAWGMFSVVAYFGNYNKNK